MSNPIFVDCPADTWTKVATDVFTGQIWRASTKPNIYKHTYRDTGETAPVDPDEGMPIFVGNERAFENISAVSGIDVYIYATNEAGRVRVDL